MARKVLGSDTDVRHKRADSYKIGDKLKGSNIAAIRRERKGGRHGLRIVLADGRRAWMRPETRVYDAEFTRP
jgi:hypothetical protein